MSYVLLIAFWLQLATFLTPVGAAVAVQNTDLKANGAFADLITVKASFYRALCDANPVTWDQGLADKAKERVWDCNLQYDYWSPEGQIIFRMVGENDRIVNSPNATNFAVDHWYAMRENYTNIESDDYDEMQPFYPAWEFTQMVWKANTKVGCAYATDADCPDVDSTPNDNMYQLYCLFTPGGNRFDEWGANVECKDCKNVQPQTSTIKPMTLTLEEEKRTAGSVAVAPKEVDKAWEIAMRRVNGYLTMDDAEFTSRWDLPAATSGSKASQTG